MKRYLVGLLVLVVGLVAGGMFVANLSVDEPLAVETESSNSQVVRSIKLSQDVVLLSLGIQGIAEENIRSTIFGQPVPGSGRTTFLQYSYDAKLGIDGRSVTITETGEDAFRISIPEFVFLGHNNAEFQTVVEDNGVISFVTPEIDTADVITRVLDEQARAQHLADNDEALKAQAEAFYSGIVHAIDPDVSLTFHFRGDGA